MILGDLEAGGTWGFPRHRDVLPAGQGRGRRRLAGRRGPAERPRDSQEGARFLPERGGRGCSSHRTEESVSGPSIPRPSGPGRQPPQVSAERLLVCRPPSDGPLAAPRGFSTQKSRVFVCFHCGRGSFAAVSRQVRASPAQRVPLLSQRGHVSVTNVVPGHKPCPHRTRVCVRLSAAAGAARSRCVALSVSGTRPLPVCVSRSETGAPHGRP